MMKFSDLTEDVAEINERFYSRRMIRTGIRHLKHAIFKTLKSLFPMWHISGLQLL